MAASNTQWGCLQVAQLMHACCCLCAGYGQMASLVCSWISKTDQDAQASTSEQADEVTHMQVPPAPLPFPTRPFLQPPSSVLHQALAAAASLASADLS